MLALLLLASTAKAEYFYWRAPVYGFDKFPTRDAAAQAVLSVYTENDRDNYNNHYITSIDPSPEGVELYIVQMIGYYFGATPPDSTIISSEKATAAHLVRPMTLFRINAATHYWMLIKAYHLLT